MPKILVALLLALLCGAALPAAHADDPPADTKARLEALQKTLVEIQKSLEDLNQRLDDLEKAMDKEEQGEAAKPARRKPKKAEPKKDEAETKDGEKPAEGETPKGDDEPEAKPEEGDAEPSEAPAEGEEEEPGIDPAILEVAGTYAFDVDSIVESAIAAMMAEAGDELPPEFAEMFAEQLRKQLESSDMTFVFETDLTWKMSGTMGDEEQSASGTWSRDGDTLRLEQTHENGEESEEPTILVGTWEDGRIEIRPEEEADSAMAIILVKQE